MMELTEKVDYLVDMQQAADYLGVELNVFGLHDALLKRHKFIHKSLKPLIHEDNDRYWKELNKRDEYLCCCIGDIIETKHNYQQQYGILESVDMKR